MIGWLVRLFVCSLVRWFVGSLVCCFVGSLVRWFVVSLVRWFVGSLVRWFVGSLVRWFVLSLEGLAGEAVGFIDQYYNDNLKTTHLDSQSTRNARLCFDST